MIWIQGESTIHGHTVNLTMNIDYADFYEVNGAVQGVLLYTGVTHWYLYLSVLLLYCSKVNKETTIYGNEF